MIHSHGTHCQQDYNSCLVKLTNTRVFSRRHITSFMSLGMPDSTSALCLGAALNGEITMKKHKKWGKHSTKQTVKKTLAYSMRAETWGQSVTLFVLSWDRVHRVTQISPCSPYIHKWPQKHCECWLGEHEEILVSKLANMEPVNNEDGRHLLPSPAQHLLLLLLLSGHTVNTRAYKCLHDHTELIAMS